MVLLAISVTANERWRLIVEKSQKMHLKTIGDKDALPPTPFSETQPSIKRSISTGSLPSEFHLKNCSDFPTNISKNNEEEESKFNLNLENTDNKPTNSLKCPRVIVTSDLDESTVLMRSREILPVDKRKKKGIGKTENLDIPVSRRVNLADRLFGSLICFLGGNNNKIPGRSYPSVEELDEVKAGLLKNKIKSRSLSEPLIQSHWVRENIREPNCQT